MRVSWHPFNSAHYAVPPALMRADAPPGPPLRITTTWSVLRHPQGVVVLDTGAPRGDPDAEMAPGADVVSRLAGLGLAPGDVRWVVNTHLHVDHVGGNAALAGATFLVDAAELAYARAPDDPVLAAEYPALGALAYEPLPAGDHDVFGDGTVVLLATPGHAAGHRSVLVRLPETGAVVITGDAIWTRANLDPEVLPGLLWSAEAYRNSHARLLALAQREGARWFHSHEPDCFAPGGWREGAAYG